MYKAFKIFGNDIETDLNEDLYSEFYNSGIKLYNKFKSEIEKNLNTFRNVDGTLDGTQLTAEWFPLIKADVFISHSHKDINTAILIAGLLYKKHGIKCFIDSCIWGYADDLLRIIDNEFCLKPSGSYSYEKRNYSTSHVHMMLSIALTKMINNTECLFFLNTPNSIYPKDTIPGHGRDEDQTLSPWIHAEIEMTKLIKKKNAREHRNFQKAFSEESESLLMLHSVDTSHMEKLTFDELYNWANKSYDNKFEALDNLYEIHNRILLG